MKIKIYHILPLLLFVLLLACNNDEKDKDSSDSLKQIQPDSSILMNDTTHANVKDTLNNEKKTVVKNNSKYICPQNDKEGNSDKTGTCPACGMELIENPDYTPVKPK